MVANYAKRPIPPYLHQNPSVQVRRKGGKRTKKRTCKFILSYT